MAQRIKPYRFTELERWTRAQLLVLKTMMAYLPGSALGSDFKQTLKETISKLVGAEVDLWLDSILTAPGPAVLGKLSDPACLALIGMPPSDHHLILDLDLKLAAMAVDRMLGGTGEDADPSRPLSSIEQGLVSFVLLKVMHAAQGVLAEEQPVALRLTKLFAHPEALKDHLQGDQVVLGFKVFLDLQVGYARLVVPAEMVRTTLAQPVDPDGPVFQRRLASMRQRLHRVAWARTTLVVEVGRSELSEADLSGVDAGDILLVEKTGVRKSGEALEGDVEVRVGTGTHGVVHGRLGEQDGQQVVEITALETLAEPDPAMAEEENLEEASPDEAVAADSEEDDVQESDEETDAAGSGEGAEEARDTPLRPAGTCPGRPQGRPGFGPRVPVVGAGGDADLAGDLEERLARAEHGEEQVDDEDEEPQEEEQGEEEGGEEEGGEEEEAPSDNLGETEGLLRDIPLSVVIELGRIKTTAGDIVAMRAGQILELRRAPNDPVNITVNGKLIGKGELVEVEGELGVRILSLVR
jgi:flagellar motor switch protein FliN